MKQLIIQQLSIDEFKTIIGEVIELSLSQRQNEDEFFNVAQASQYLKIPITTLYDYTSNDKIPFHKKGKTLHFSKHELSAWMKSKQRKEVSCKSLE